MENEIVKEGMGNLKKTIIGIITTAVTAAGAYVTTHINEVFGIEEESDAPTEMVAPVENNNTQQQNVNVQGPTINLTIPQAAPTQTIVRETVREVPAQPAPQAAPVEEKPETNAERMARLKKMREEKGGN
jgi:hypothetical protein